MFHNILRYWLVYLLLLDATTNSAEALKMGMSGTISLGDAVFKELTNVLLRNGINSRRSGGATGVGVDTIEAIVNKAKLCAKPLTVCQGDMKIIINDYVLALSKVIQILIDGKDEEYKPKQEEQKKIFIRDPEQLFEVIKKILVSSNMKFKDDNDVYVFENLLKKIASKMQEEALLMVAEKFDEKTAPDAEVNYYKTLAKKIVIATALVENEYVKKICSELDLCVKSYEFTRILNTILGKLKTAKDEKIKNFVKSFSETLYDTNFPSLINPTLANEFQNVLTDMTFSDNVQTKEILMSVLDNVENRLKMFEGLKTDDDLTIDGLLFHVILSDMDHFYSKANKVGFTNFLKYYNEWHDFDGHLLSPHMKLVFESIEKDMEKKSDLLKFKLGNEIRLFLDLTTNDNRT